MPKKHNKNQDQGIDETEKTDQSEEHATETAQEGAAQQSGEQAASAAFEAVLADERYSDAGPDVKPIAQDLILNHHKHLMYARIRYLFDLQEEPKQSKGKAVIGTAQSVSGLLRLFSRSDFIITLHAQTWERLTDNQKAALLDHEFCHCIKDEDGFYKTKGHDLEEFSDVIGRHGFWRNDVKAMAAVFQKEFEFTKGQIRSREG